MAVGSFRLPISAGGTPPAPSTTGHMVRYFDPFGVIIDTQYIADGEDATAPTAPTLDLLTFYGWNHDGTNITRNEDIGAIYDTTDGKTYIFVCVNVLTGLQPTIYFYKATSAQMTINWGDGTTNTTTSTGYLNVQKTAAYSTAGYYTITLTCSGRYELGGYDNTTSLFTSVYRNIAYKVYFGANTSILNTEVFYEHLALKYVVLASAITGSLDNVFYYCVTLKHINIPIGMTGNIGSQAFYFANSLINISLSQNMTGSSSYSEFDSCFSLSSLTYPKGYGAPGAYCAFQCLALKYVALSTVVTDLPFKAFFFMGAESFTIPATVTTIGASCFEQNIAREYIFQSSTPPTLADTSVFLGIRFYTRIYVPHANVNDYKTASNWSTYADYIYSINDRP